MNRSQVTGETSTRASGTFSYGYDGGTSGGPGNPTSFKGRTSTFNSDNQNTNSGYGYDGNGNPTTLYSTAVTFDPENRLTYTVSGGLKNNYTYDGDGHQVTRIAYGLAGPPKISLYKLYDGDTLVSQYAGGSSLSSTISTGADGLVSVYSAPSSVTTFYTFDERGNVSQRLDKTGSIVSSDVYDAYGTCTTTASSQYDFVGYGGEWGYYYDGPLGLTLCTHRYYSSYLGRWLTRDPLGYGGGINLYGYVGNDPGNRWDPSGYLQDGWGDLRNGAVGGAIVLLVVLVIGAPVSLPVIVGAVVAGAILGGLNESGQGGNSTDIAEGAGLGGASGGAVACLGLLIKPPPSVNPPSPPPPPPDSVWPPPPADPITGEPLPPPSH